MHVCMRISNCADFFRPDMITVNQWSLANMVILQLCWIVVKFDFLHVVDLILGLILVFGKSHSKAPYVFLICSHYTNTIGLIPFP